MEFFHCVLYDAIFILCLCDIDDYLCPGKYMTNIMNSIHLSILCGVDS